jgi:predicted transcriptional regulator
MSDIIESKDKETLAENKLMILYLLNKANCTLSNLQIQRLLYDVDEFNYYYLQHIIAELVSQNYIANYKQEDEWLYDITREGKEVLELTSDVLPGIKKLKLDTIIEKELSKVKNEVSVIAQYVPENDNEYVTKCKITESHKNLFELNIYCTSASQAKQISENWKKHANEYYPKIIEMLTEK